MKHNELDGMATIPGYPAYAITPEGVVFNLRTRRMLRSFPSTYGYPAVRLCRNGQGRNHYIHRLLMDTFVGRPIEPGDWTVDHRNGVRDDNRLPNLQWLTRGENTRQANMRRKARKSAQQET